MKASMVATADTREALSQSASIVIQNLEATLACNYISLLQGHFFFCMSNIVTITRVKHHLLPVNGAVREQDASGSLKLF